MAATKRTVLALHGYSQNATIFSKRIGALRKECSNDIEFVFIDAPHVLQPVDLVGAAPDNSLSSLGSPEAANADTDPALTPRAWFKVDRERTECRGLKDSIELVRDVLKTRKFDGVFGFSQGAAFAAVVAALLEKPHLYPSFLIDGESPHPPLQFCIAVSGFRMRDATINNLFEPSFSTYTLHVLGRNDIIVTEERSRILIEASANKRIEQHDGGHFVPSKGQWRKFLHEFMVDPFRVLASPGASPSSGQSSGAVTPVGEALMMKL